MSLGLLHNWSHLFKKGGELLSRLQIGLNLREKRVDIGDNGLALTRLVFIGAQMRPRLCQQRLLQSQLARVGAPREDNGKARGQPRRLAHIRHLGR
jgi:hypothetical protein